jgi:hypothetical protein
LSSFGGQQWFEFPLVALCALMNGAHNLENDRFCSTSPCSSLKSSPP